MNVYTSHLNVGLVCVLNDISDLIKYNFDLKYDKISHDDQ